MFGYTSAVWLCTCLCSGTLQQYDCVPSFFSNDCVPFFVWVRTLTVNSMLAYLPLFGCLRTFLYSDDCVPSFVWVYPSFQCTIRQRDDISYYCHKMTIWRKHVLSAAWVITHEGKRASKGPRIIYEKAAASFVEITRMPFNLNCYLGK